MRLEGLAAVAVIAVAGCSARELPPDGHILVELDTDAPLPASSPGPAAIFDAVKLDVLRSDGTPACADCSREHPLSREDVDRGMSFVVVSDTQAVLHVRMFRSAFGAASLERTRIVEQWVRLPPRPPEGAVRVRVVLRAESVGQPAGSLHAPVDPTILTEGQALVGPLTFEPAQAPLRDDEVCLPGGLFWMGDPRIVQVQGDVTSPVEATLVQLAPFCVDAHELTVREMRPSATRGDVIAWSETTDPKEARAFCLFTASPGPNEDRPVNCVSWEAARAACRERAGDLPTEAQFEYLASALGRSTFVWGREPPRCEDAVFGRSVGVAQGDKACQTSSSVAFWPLPAAEVERMRDVLVVGDRRVVGLAANLCEWTRDAFERSEARCGLPQVGIARDPECAPTASTTTIALRGGAFTSSAAQTAAALRASVGREKLRVDLGFRCVRERPR